MISLNFVASIGLCALCYAIYEFKRIFRQRSSKAKLVVAFFHPYANSAGGGERVLWSAISAIQKQLNDKVDIVVYTGDNGISSEAIIQKTEQVFGLRIEAQNLSFVYIQSRPLLEARWYPVFTMLCQSAFSMLVGLECLMRKKPDIFIDSTGYAFTLLVAKFIFRCKTFAYIHYPTISEDMLHAVKDRTVAFNNQKYIVSTPFLLSVKLIYYKLFAWLYRQCSTATDIVVVNSSWTFQHISSLWARSDAVTIFPPCDLNLISRNDPSSREKCKLVSLAQFRPEKNHMKQLRIMKLLTDTGKLQAKLVMIGGVRNSGDEKIVSELQEYSKLHHLDESIEIVANASYERLQEELKSSSIGLHTMKDEHFGIGIVELMASGLIMIAHNSGGPKCDIIEEGVSGFLGDTDEEYAEKVKQILNMSDAAKRKIADNARQDCQKRFSQEAFECLFIDELRKLF